MASIPPSSRVVIGGIDTHKDLHVAAVIDTAGVVLATEAFSTTRATAPCCAGCAASATCAWSAWRAPAATALASPAT